MMKLLKKQKGAVLLICLIVLTALLTASVALINSTKSATVISGNISYRQAATTASDVGITLAINSLNAVGNLETTTPNTYYATQQPVDNNGIPTTIDWNTVPTSTIQNYNTQYVIERLCTGVLPVSDYESQCNLGLSNTASSNKSGSPIYYNNATYYRVTIRTVGPKNSTSWVQAILVRQ